MRRLWNAVAGRSGDQIKYIPGTSAGRQSNMLF